jgi:anti-sigma factor RsiW
MNSASGRSVVTRADEGVAPVSRGATQPATQGSTGVADLTHDLVRGQASDYLDDTLSEAVRHRIDRHLASCTSCAAHLETLRTTVQALGQLPARKAPSGARARILEQARSEQARREQA